MRTLFDDAYAPFTGNIGFVRATLDEAVEIRLTRTHPRWGATEIPLADPAVPEALLSLLPHVLGGHDRELLVDCGEWVAVFANGDGPSGRSSAEHVAGWLETESVAVWAVPQVNGNGLPGRMGVLEMSWWKALPEHRFTSRVVHVSNQGSRWEFVEVGEPLPFEDVDRYRVRPTRNRLSSDLLADYLGHLGIRPFDDDFYTGPARLVHMRDLATSQPHIATLDEVRTRMGWEPGQTAASRG